MRAGASACYRGGRRARIVVPATGPRVVETLLHEYGHHLDASRPHGRVREPNGARRWYSSRRIASRLRAGTLARDYSKGWGRSVAEVFAEDYVRLHYRVPWRLRSVPAPTADVLRALRIDLTGIADGPPPAAPPPLVITRTGHLGPGATTSVPFGLIGPRRRVQVTVVVDGGGAPARVGVTVQCDDVTVASEEARDGAPVEFDRSGLGPARCALTLSGREGTARFDLTLTLTITS